MSYMGVDIGTTGCKAVVFDDRGGQLALAYREYPLLSPQPGWAEIDSRQVMERCFEVIREAAAAVPADPVRGLCVSSQGEAFTPVGADGTLLGNGMVSSDGRAAELSRTWSEEFGRRKLYRSTGHSAHPMFTLFKLLWVRDHQPDVWTRTRQFLCFEDLLHLRLGLEPAISWPLAGRTMLFDVRKHRWDADILAAVGLQASQLARPLASGKTVGTIPAAIARSLGLPDGVVVAAGGHDQTCAALGAGVTAEGRAMYATGTVECICPAFDTPRFSAELFRSNLCTYNFTLPGKFTTVAFSLTGGNLLKWFRDEWSQAETAEAARSGRSPYELILNNLPDRPTNLMVLPYFTPTGTPYFDPHATGAILGLRLSTTRGEVLRALLEGVALEMRLNMDILDRSGICIRELIASGGGAKSGRMTQLKADVLNRPITTLPITETGCFGAALLAQSAHTGEPAAQLAEARIRRSDEVRPDPERAAFYSERFERYKTLYPALKKIELA